jgi:hypothetical protein
VFFRGKFFQASLMFASKAGAYGIEIPQEPNQGTLNEGEGSVQLTSLY